MTIPGVISDFDSAGESDLGEHLSRLKRIERVLRNGLPTDDEAEASTIAHAHSEVELLLESIDEDWWMR